MQRFGFLITLTAVGIVLSLIYIPTSMMNLYVNAQKGSFLSISSDSFAEDDFVGPQLTGSITCDPNAATISQDDQGQLVTLLQQSLMALGYPLPQFGADGQFGQETFAAVVEFQVNNGLEPDGIVDPNTWAALCDLINGTGGGSGTVGDQGFVDTTEKTTQPPLPDTAEDPDVTAYWIGIGLDTISLSDMLGTLELIPFAAASWVGVVAPIALFAGLAMTATSGAEHPYIAVQSRGVANGFIGGALGLQPADFGTPCVGGSTSLPCTMQLNDFTKNAFAEGLQIGYNKWVQGEAEDINRINNGESPGMYVPIAVHLRSINDDRSAIEEVLNKLYQNELNQLIQSGLMGQVGTHSFIQEFETGCTLIWNPDNPRWVDNCRNLDPDIDPVPGN